MKLQALLDRLAVTVKGYVDRRVGEIDARVKALGVEIQEMPRATEELRRMVEARPTNAPPSVEELKAIIAPLIPAPVHGEKGADGKDGVDGRDGQDGKDGRDGIDGRTPSAEEIKALIPAPIHGEKGADGKDGRDGRDGADGRDGLDIAPIPAIDETKSYPRGTYAAHKGGLWRSFEQTKGLKGWECIVNGFNGFEEEQVDERTFIVRCFTSTGVIEATRKVASIVYRELWVKGASYELGDAVTWGGSIWIAKKHDGEYKQPGTEGSGWRLAVRAGRDGDRS